MTLYNRRITVCSGLSQEDNGVTPARNAYVSLTNTAGNAGYTIRFKRYESNTALTVTTVDGVTAMRPDGGLPYRYYGYTGFYELRDASGTRNPAAVYTLEFDCQLCNIGGWHKYLQYANLANLVYSLGSFFAGMPFLAIMTGSTESSKQPLFVLDVRPYQGRPWLFLRGTRITGSTTQYCRTPMPEALMRGERVHFCLRSTPMIQYDSSSNRRAFSALYADGTYAGQASINTSNASHGWVNCEGFVIYQTLGCADYNTAGSDVWAFPYLEISGIDMKRMMSTEGAPPTAEILTDIHDTYADLTVKTGVNYGA